MSPDETEFQRGQRVEREVQMRKDVDLLVKRVEGVEQGQVALAKQFAEFVTAARTAAEAASQAAAASVSTKTFVLGVLAIILTAVGLVAGHA